jgi:2,4-diketo-3-deoxy-L-fuconate hydrolase
MKLTRFHDGNRVRPGLFLDQNTILDASSFGSDWNEEFFATDGLAKLAAWSSAHRDSAPTVSAKDVRLAPAIARPSKIVCVGLNYIDHARETGATPPAEPVLFFKSTSAWCGPNDDLVIPRGSQKTDWEVELAVVIGRRASHVLESNALDYVAGYALHNDYSERAWQLEGTGQWVKGKSADTFAPFGPYLATKDELNDVGNLRLWLKVNGAIRQDGSTRNLIFPVPHLISFISNFMTLLPGDVISTGTPAGVALGMKPPHYLVPGDRVELGVEGLGVQRQLAVKYAE